MGFFFTQSIETNEIFFYVLGMINIGYRVSFDADGNVMT